ncbi:MAG: hypothetical protein HC920_07540 [Oscillatoriales cyanobacterium SM2_3_0]|nr:hypothetical protein [Oscillatoriales cyanobacterium SM2_3_0]
MTPSPEELLKIQIQVDPDNPALLEGLELWRNLGLLTDMQIKRICHEFLSQPLPPPQVQSGDLPIQDGSQTLSAQVPTAFASQALPKSTATRANAPNFVTQMAQSFRAELSVRWLLFLGLFTVLVSSGLLAASQWEKFSAVGQYGILLTYTLGFLIATFWTGQQSRLQLTAETLRWVTLLLVPLNFWGMDGLGLKQHPLGWIMMAIATVILTGITIILNQTQRQAPKLFILNQLGLSYLQLGWSGASWPLLAIYIGAILTAGITGYRYWIDSGQREISRVRLPDILYLFPLSFLIIRGIFAAQIEVTQLGVIFAIISGLLYFNPGTWLHHLGYGLLFWGWLVSLVAPPWQTILVNGIGLGIFLDRLSHFWQRRDLGLIYLIGAQVYWLLSRLVPEGVRSQLTETIIQLTQSENNPEALASLIWLPYLIFIVGVTDWLYQRQKSQLAKFSDRAALGLGSFLTVISFVNPVVRTLNLLASTLILAGVGLRRQSVEMSVSVSVNRTIIYLTHLAGLLTLFSAIDWVFPDLGLEYWGVLLTGVAVIELGISSLESYLGSESRSASNPGFPPAENPTGNRSQFKQQSKQQLKTSAWYFGLGLGGLSYSFFFIPAEASQNLSCIFLGCQNAPFWGVSWLLIPVTLTLIGVYSPRTRTQLASELGCVTVGLAQLLTFGFPGIRSISLGIGAVLLLMNSRLLQRQNIATIAIGLSLTFVGSLIWEISPNLSLAGWLMALAMVILGVWIIHQQLRRFSTPLALLYQTATKGWGVMLCGFQLFSLTVYIIFTYWQVLSSSFLILGAIIMTLGAIGYGSWSLSRDNSAPSNPSQALNLYALGWVIELLIAASLSFSSRGIFYLSIANIILGLLTQWLGSYWQRRHQLERLPYPWQVLPLFYGIFGVVLRSTNFDNWTGLSILGLALILIGIGRCHLEFKTLVYLGLTGISLGLYQLLAHQLETFPIGRQLIGFAALGTTILYGYRVLSPWLISTLNFTNLEIKRVSHFHWAVSSLLLILATQFPLESVQSLALGTGYFLSQYAIWQGRRNPHPLGAEIWVYMGCLEAIALFYYVSTLFPWGETLELWAGAIASGVGYFLYFLPWESWGWSLKPWHRVAVILPIGTVLVTRTILNADTNFFWYISAGITTLFYLILARFNHQIRLTYFSLFLVNWILLVFLTSTAYRLNSLEYSLLPGLSLLYFAQVEPGLKSLDQKPPRHLLRMIGIGMICTAALLSYPETGLVPFVISLGSIFIGLGLQIRAFLYVGTVTFLINLLNQMIILSSIYPFFKWIVGLLIGLILIWIAANFETRREQMLGLVQSWTRELEHWD